MCLTAIGSVVVVEGGEAVVDLDGRRRRAISLAIPDLHPGDLVLVGLGAVLGRVDPADRAALERLTPPGDTKSDEARPAVLPGPTRASPPGP